MIYVCNICGYVHEGELLFNCCPACLFGAHKMSRVEEAVIHSNEACSGCCEY